MPKTKEMKRKSAEKLKEACDALSIDERLSRLSGRPGKATKERQRLINKKKALKAKKAK